MPWTDFEKVDELFKLYFKVTAVKVAYHEIKHELGGSLRYTTLTGHPDGERIWTVKHLAVDTLTQGVTTDQYGTETGARYMWNLFKRCKAAGNKPILLTCPVEKDIVTAQFDNSEMEYEWMATNLWNNGIVFRQLRMGAIIDGSIQVDNPSVI